MLILEFFFGSFIQLDLGQLKITNEFSWHGVAENDPAAVHIDVLHAEVSNLFVSVSWFKFQTLAYICTADSRDQYIRGN